MSASERITVVSFTFDDGWKTDLQASSLLAAHGMRGTFYVSSNAVGREGYVTWDELAAIQGGGHEIGGHTLDHVDLTAVARDEAYRQVAVDREVLLARGFDVTSFAYPHGAYNGAVQKIVREVGYTSARGAWGLRNIAAVRDRRPRVAAILVANPFGIETPCCIDGNTSLEMLRDYIRKAERVGGWVPLVFHRISDEARSDGAAPSLSPARLEALLGWLEARAQNGTVVRTLGQVITQENPRLAPAPQPFDARTAAPHSIS
jgi:peptidoglycan/xylan/chitin deacetylase (PgdA/CDA1 family)